MKNTFKMILANGAAVAFLASAASASTILDTLPRDDQASLLADGGQTWMTGALGIGNRLTSIEVATRSSSAAGGSVYLAVYQNNAASGSATNWSKGSLLAMSTNTQNMSLNGITNTFRFSDEPLADNARYLYTFVNASTNGVNVGIGVRLNTGGAQQSTYTAGGIAFSGSHTIASRIKTRMLNPGETGVKAWFGSTDKRYLQDAYPVTTGTNFLSGTAWRGERYNAQIVLWAWDTTSGLSVSATPMTNGQGASFDVLPQFVKSSIADDGGNACADNRTRPTTLQPDAIDTDASPITITNQSAQPVWVTVNVPTNVPAGNYQCTITVTGSGSNPVPLTLNLVVLDRVLPAPSQWSFHLDLWQNPWAIARYYGLTVWSAAHRNAITNQLAMLANAGQKVVTATIVHQPWGGQTYDPHQSLIEWTKNVDATWSYDFTRFDDYVGLAQAAGISEQINCYSMVAWGDQYRYYDAARSSNVTLTLTPGTPAYTNHWTPFLQAFRAHLIAKGWINKTVIAMDERGESVTRAAIDLVKAVAPELKIAAAGHYFASVEPDLYDWSVQGSVINSQALSVIQNRAAAGKISTFYGACDIAAPNMFTYSPPVEIAWHGWYAAAAGFNGTLRWAYDGWVADPLADTRHSRFPAGDCFQIYPGPRSSIRFESLRDGIEEFEKIRILKQTLNGTRLQSLQAILAGLNTGFYSSGTSAAALIPQAREDLAELAAASEITSPDPATCYAWFKGDVGITPWAAVTNWPNQATSGANPAARNLDRISGTPTGLAVVTPGSNTTVVRMDGADATWGTSANFGSLTSNRTLVAYCRLTSTNGGFLFDGSTSSGMTRAQVRNGSWQAGLQPSPIGNGANADTNTLPATNGVWQAHIFSFEKLASSTRVTHSIAGTATFTYTNSETVGLGGLILGMNVAAALGLAVDVAELIVYDRALGSTEQSNVVSYLATKWGSPTNAPPPDMEVLSCTAAQTNRTVPNFGLHYVLDAQVVTTGQGNAVSLTNITFTFAGSPAAAADVAAVTVYFTGTTNQFRTLVPFATYNGPMTGTISLAGSQMLQWGTNHFWITVEPKPRAPWGHVLDAELISVGVTGVNGGTKLPAIAAPPEFLTLGNAPFYNVLRARGDNGSFEFRIPGLAVTTNGTLIATFDVRWNAINDLPANIDVACLRSTDLGNTWGPMITVLDYDKNVAGSSGNGVGDAAVLVDRQTGTIWVAALWSFGNRSIAGSQTGTATNRTGQYVLSRSDDDGLTWSAPINITVEAKANTNWGCTFVGPGNGIQLRNGTLVFPSQHTQPGGGQGKVFFIYSTNHGASWAVSPDVTTNSSPTMNESQMVELNSGQIMTSMRMSGGGGGFRGWSTYTPGSSLSNGTWSPLLLNLPDPICQGSFIRYSSTLDGAPRNRLLFSNPSNSVPSGYASRVRQTIYMSEDEGATWPVARQIDAKAGYSGMAVLPDGTIGLFYEAPADYDMVFARVSMDWLTQADVDGDGDGMSDYYEGINGLNTATNDAALDADGDGLNNSAEFLAGTMSNNAASKLHLQTGPVTGTNLTLIWPSVLGVTYALEQASQLQPAAWSAVPGGEAMQAMSATMSFTVPVSGDTRQFFRVRVLPAR